MGFQNIANFLEQIILVKGFLFNQFFYASVQANAVGMGEFFGRDDHNGYGPPFGVFSEFFDELKSVHDGHHQIQENNAWRFFLHTFKGTVFTQRSIIFR